MARASRGSPRDGDEDDDDEEEEEEEDISQSDRESDDGSSEPEEGAADVEDGEASSEEEGEVAATEEPGERAVEDGEEDDKLVPRSTTGSAPPSEDISHKAEPDEGAAAKQMIETDINDGKESNIEGTKSIKSEWKEDERERRKQGTTGTARTGHSPAVGEDNEERALEEKSRTRRSEERREKDDGSSRKSSSKKRKERDKDRSKDESRSKDRKRRQTEKRASRSRSKDRKGEPSSYEKQLMAYYRRREEPDSNRGKTEQATDKRHSREDRYKDIDREKESERERRDRQKDQEKRDRDREDRDKERERARARERERERDTRRKREKEYERRRLREKNEDRSRGRDRNREGSSNNKQEEKNVDSMEEEQAVLDEDTQDKILAEIEMGMSKDEIEEQRLIEERRKRRLEIIARHSQVSAPSQIKNQSMNGETDDNNGAQEDGSFNLTKPSSEIFEVEDHPGSHLDDREDRVERIPSYRKDSVNTEAKKNDDDDDLADMFADDVEEEEDMTKAVTTKAPVQALLDNWDDPEGYYNFRVGEVLADRFEVYASWGKGVFSTVLRARDKKSVDTDVAIKIIRSNDTMYKAGQLEMKILRRLAERDPDGKRHCIRILEDFEYRGHLCMVFEAMDMNLREVLKKYGRNIGLNITAVRAYAAQLLIALKHTKQCGILHADIKPDNILVDKSNRHLKLADFGSAMLVGENERTPYLVSRFYRGPEVILGLAYDFAMDTWSIATALFELFTGKILFPGNSNNQMLKLMQEVKGPFSRRMLKKGIFVEKHFDSEGRFMSIEADPVTGQDLKRHLSISKPVRELSRLLKVSKSNDDVSKLNRNFCDMLDRMLILDPEKRLTVEEALAHPFIKG